MGGLLKRTTACALANISSAWRRVRVPSLPCSSESNLFTFQNRCNPSVACWKPDTLLPMYACVLPASHPNIRPLQLLAGDLLDEIQMLRGRLGSLETKVLNGDSGSRYSRNSSMSGTPNRPYTNPPTPGRQLTSPSPRESSQVANLEMPQLSRQGSSHSNSSHDSPATKLKARPPGVPRPSVSSSSSTGEGSSNGSRKVRSQVAKMSRPPVEKEQGVIVADADKMSALFGS